MNRGIYKLQQSYLDTIIKTTALALVARTRCVRLGGRPPDSIPWNSAKSPESKACQLLLILKNDMNAPISLL
jgi:hypothetical protein